VKAGLLPLEIQRGQARKAFHGAQAGLWKINIFHKEYRRMKMRNYGSEAEEDLSFKSTPLVASFRKPSWLLMAEPKVFSK